MAKVNEALGMIETKGFIALLEATDAMLKAAKVSTAAPKVPGIKLEYQAPDVLLRCGIRRGPGVLDIARGATYQP